MYLLMHCIRARTALSDRRRLFWPCNFCAQASCFERVTFPKRKRNESRISISQRPFLKPKSNIYMIKRKVVTGSFALPAQNRKMRCFFHVFCDFSWFSSSTTPQPALTWLPSKPLREGKPLLNPFFDITLKKTGLLFCL